MEKFYPIIDFHSHVVSPAELVRLCPEDQKTAFFKYIVPAIERVAHFSEPVHYRFLRYLALNFNDRLSLLAWGYCGELGLMETLRLFKTYDYKRLLHSMERNHVKHTVIYSLEPVTYTNELLELTKDHRDKITIFGSASMDIKDKAAYLEPFLKSKRIGGIKIHPIVGGYFGHELLPQTKDIAALATEYDVPITIHTGHIPVERLSGLKDLTDVPALEPLIAAFPKCTFVLNHMGWESWRKAFELGQKYPNIMVETSWQPARRIRRAVDKLGSHRVLFGSDFPLFQQWQALKEARKALSDREFKEITSLNAMRLLKMESAQLATQKIS